MSFNECDRILELEFKVSSVQKSIETIKQNFEHIDETQQDIIDLLNKIRYFIIGGFVVFVVKNTSVIDVIKMWL